MPKVWNILPQKSDDLVSQLLINRGITSEKEKELFFNGKLADYEKDLNIPGIKKAFDRIEKAIKNGEQIIVYGDYDVDGITASAILYKALTSLGAKVLPYIPHREKEGYGLSKIGLEFARDSGASLVITVDNGIVALEQAKFAKEIGLDLIITDHHLPLDSASGHGPLYPEALAIVHSVKMCGAGVAWCLVRNFIKKDLADELLELVCIATVADMIPLTGLGRVFVMEGLKRLNKTKNLGLLSLLRECEVEQGNIDSYTLGHKISPRLNAIGRLEHAIDALRLLCTKEPLKAKKLASLLCEANTQRQTLTIEALDQAKLKVKQDKKIHILSSKDWHPGIIGLIAARITEEHSKPAIAISVGEKVSKGSARSIDGVNIVEVIRECSDLLIDIGGHKGAAGFSLANENLNLFQEKLETVIEGYQLGDVKPSLEIEAEVEFKKITKSLVKEINSLEPFGFQNPQPLLATKNLKVSDIRTVGGGKHLKFKAEGIDAIAFGMGEWSEILKSGQLINLAYFLEINKFNGQEILQLKVKDIKISG
jgi:single-stranded-DNA-specific exonuclease